MLFVVVYMLDMLSAKRHANLSCYDDYSRHVAPDGLTNVLHEWHGCFVLFVVIHSCAPNL